MSYDRASEPTDGDDFIKLLRIPLIYYVPRMRLGYVIGKHVMQLLMNFNIRPFNDSVNSLP